MSELKLKPCPCCESDEVIYFKKTRNRGYVTCIACGMRTRGCGNYENKDDLKWRERATILWNRRTPMANIVEKLEEKTEFLKDCTKYGNESAEQQEKSYSTMMMYEVADLVDDLINIVKQEINNGN